MVGSASIARAACAPVPQGVGKIRCSSITAIVLHPQQTWSVRRSMLFLFACYEVPSCSGELLLQPCLIAEPLQGPIVVLNQPPLYAAYSHDLFTPSLHGQPCCLVALHDCSWLAGLTAHVLTCFVRTSLPPGWASIFDLSCQASLPTY